MSVTTDPESITNSVMLEVDKVLRKNGLAPAGHRHYDGNRQVLKGLIEIVVADAQEHGDVPRS